MSIKLIKIWVRMKFQAINYPTVDSDGVQAGLGAADEGEVAVGVGAAGDPGGGHPGHGHLVQVHRLAQEVGRGGAAVLGRPPALAHTHCSTGVIILTQET